MPPVTIRQSAILVGGLGTRLGGLTAATPKPLLPCGDRPFLAWLLREQARFGVTDFLLLSGHLSEQVQAMAPRLAAGLPRTARVRVAVEPFRAGTGGALVHAGEQLAEQFLLCNGDSLLDCNLSPLLAAAAADDASVTGRMLLRALPDASRYGVVTLAGDRVTGFRERPPPGPTTGATPGTINAGIYRFRRRLLDSLSPACSLEAEVLPRLAAAGALRGTVADGYFRDIGVPDDFRRAQSEVPALLHRPALFLDRDGVLNVDHGYVGSREQFQWIDGALDTIRHATQAGWHVFVVTNQAGVARGYYDEAAVHDLLDWMADEARRAGGTIDDARYCPFHEAAVVDAYRRPSDWRKPAPGMLLDLIRRWELDPARCVMIGDQATDMAAAAAARVRGHRFVGGNLLAFVRPIMAAMHLP